MTTVPDNCAPRSFNRRGHLLALGGLALLVVIVFADVLCGRGAQVVSQYGEDATGEFIPFRAFGFSELAHGHLALWNPWLYCGAPFLANFQSALLYPPNWIYLVLPVNQAINFEVSFHVLLAGICMYAWCAHRRLHPASAFLAAMAFMFGGGFYAHVFPGHLPHLDVIAWAPIVLLAVDDLTMTCSPRGIWIGGAAVAMQILAGHPQFGFYTAVAAGLYALLNLRNAPSPKRSAIGLTIMFVLGASLAAVQLAPGLAVANETLRTKLDQEAAGEWSLPPEALPGVVVPGIFGPLQTTGGEWIFWGRGSFWESCLFVGLTVLSLAIFACRSVRGPTRRFAATLGVISLLIAMGRYTPLFHILYHVPGFASFRAWGRFDMLVTLFVAMLAALGLDRLLKGEKPGKWPAISLAALAALLLLGALLLIHESRGPVSNLWGTALAHRMRLSTHLHFQVTGEFVRETAVNAAADLFRTGIAAAMLAGLWWVVRHDRRVAYLMVAVAALELLGFARRYRPTFDWAQFNAKNLETANALHEVDGSDRDWADLQDVAMRYDCPDASGYDATILRRYAEMVAERQDVPLALQMQWGMKAPAESPVWQLMRVRSFVTAAADGTRIITPRPGPVLDRAMLLTDWRVMPDRTQILAALKDGSVDPSRVALLERPVEITPSGSGSAGTVQYRDINSDEIELTIDARRPAIVVLADNYAGGWRAVPIGTPGQSAYEVVPVDSVLRGIAFSPGKHHVLMQYHPNSVTAGAWISAAAWVIFALSGAAAMLTNSRLRRAPRVPASSSK